MAGRWIPGDGLPGPGSSADRLLDSAERLVAVEGLLGASSRAITLAAGHRNSNAIAYHFGDRRGLFTAVWFRRTTEIDRHRAREVTALERSGRSADPAALVAALVVPVAAELVRRTPSYWARFNEAVLSGYPLDALTRLESDGAGDPATSLRALTRTLTLLRAVSAQGREPVASRRVVQVIRTGVTTLACWERDCDGGLLDPGSLAGLCADLVQTGAAVLTAPVEERSGADVADVPGCVA
ncbi:TetR/AcrR family transcriptional regulator [Kineococcus rubinsiae]|uniref:TetR/AcrR family transcriptional regulator n=1 Tax=Kineococcus rubinsiae TaxID=2609562 RepID=UPI00142FEDE7|nr:hypothetical protein [Kineococcus rubinsiae]NIZ89778.1 hypothetical protein [Kineococcus rubinsiae]